MTGAAPNTRSGGTPPPLFCLVHPSRSLTPVVRVRLVNGRTLWVKDVVEDDDEWLRANSSRGP